MRALLQTSATTLILACSLAARAQSAAASGAPPAATSPAGAPPAPATPAGSTTATPPALDTMIQKLDTAAGKLDSAGKKLEDAGKKLEQASSKLSPSGSDPKELLAGRVTWNGVLFKFTEKEKKATVATSIPIPGGSTTFGLELTAPLDEATRRAPLLDAREQASPFRFKLSFDYNNITEHLKTLTSTPAFFNASVLCDQYTKETGAGSCVTSDEAFRHWLRAKTPTARPESAFSRGIPAGVLWTLGVEVEAGFDRQDVYDGDLASKPVQLTKTDLSVNTVFRWYPTSWLAIPLRVGAGFEDGFRAKEIERCAALPSSDASVSGKECSKALVLKSDEKLKGKGMIDVALVAALPLPGLTDLQPGIELRGKVDGLGTNEFFRGSSTLFVSPTNQPILTRFGVGVEYSVALADDEATPPSFAAGDDTLTPFVLFGGSL